MCQSTSRQVSRILGLIAMFAVLTAGCGTGEGAVGEASTTSSAAPTTQPVVASAPGDPAGSDTGDVADTSEPTEDVTLSPEPAVDSQEDNGTEPDAGEVGSSPDETDTPEAVFRAALEADEVPQAPTEGPDVYLGGSPDVYAAAAISLGLGEAGVDLTGITLSVLPITGIDASLLVMELGDEDAIGGLLTPEAGADITGALLALPEIETASITELVMVYRGVDEEGPFALTFAVSIDALREAYQTGADLGDALLVQVDRGS